MNKDPGKRTIAEGKLPTLIIGGTGKTGRRVAERLMKLGLPVRIGSRSGVPAFDGENPHTWEATLQNVGAVYITYYPDLALSGAATAIGAFADYARDAAATGVWGGSR